MPASTDPKSIFDQARAFHEVYGLIVSADNPAGPLPGFISAVVVATFAIELYLKCLLLLEEGGTIPRIHEIRRLFDMLSESTREEAGVTWDKYVAAESALFDDMDIGFQTPVPRRLPDALTVANNAFREYRYFYELQTRDWVVGEFANIMRDLILSRKPEWRLRPLTGS